MALPLLFHLTMYLLHANYEFMQNSIPTNGLSGSYTQHVGLGSIVAALDLEGVQNSYTHNINHVVM